MSTMSPLVITSVGSDGYSFTFNAATTGLPTIAPVDDGTSTGTDNVIGTTNSFATGPVADANVSSVVITFVPFNVKGVSSDAFTYPSGLTDGLGNSVGLVNGNYFLKVTNREGSCQYVQPFVKMM